MKVNLSDRGLIKVHGKDVHNFLQSQFSNDISKIVSWRVQVNAYCQHQGKIIALVWVFKDDDAYYLSVPRDLVEILLLKLNLFKLSAEVYFEDISLKINQYGLINESDSQAYVLSDNLSLLLSQKTLPTNADINDWEKECIEGKLPEVNIVSTEKYIPQDLNLDIGELGVSFSKGCYPGQEVIARLHYLGKPKRRLYNFSSKFNVKVGDTLNIADSRSLKSSGNVIRVAEIGNLCQFLGTFEVNHTKEKIYLNNDQTKLVNLIHE